MNSATNRKARKFAPAPWQWDASKILGGHTGSVQLWSAAGCMAGLVSLDRARELVSARAFFIGSDVHCCAVHDGIDMVNA